MQQWMDWTVKISEAITDDVQATNKIKQYFAHNTEEILLTYGDANFGFLHISLRHTEDFARMFGVHGNANLLRFLQDLLKDGKYKTYGYNIRQQESKRELVVIYQVDAKKFVKVPIGPNGMIISAIPSDNTNYVLSSDY